MGALDTPIRPEVRNIVQRVGTIVEKGSFGSLTTGGWTLESSTFSGWGTYCSPQQNFTGIRFYVRPWDATKPISKVRVRVLTNTYQGTVLADKTVDVLTSLGSETLIDVEFDSTIANAANDPLWVEFYTDGRTGIRWTDATSYPTPTFPKVRYSSTSDTANTTTIESTAEQRVGYYEFYQRDTSVEKVVISNEHMAMLLKSETLQKVLKSNFINTTVKEHPASVNYSFQSSTFSGWGQAIGSPQNFDQIEFKIKPWDATDPVTKVLVRIRETDYQGTIIFTKQIDFSSPIGVEKTVVVTADDVIQNTADRALWLEYFTDGKCGINILPSIEFGSPAMRYSTTGSVTNTTTIQIGSGSEKEFWYRLALRSNQPSTVTLADELLENLTFSGVSGVEAEVLLPSTIRLVQGQEFNIYPRNVFKTNTRFEDLDADFTGTYGTQHSRCWRHTPGGATSSSLTVGAWHRNKVLDQKVCTLTTVATSSGTGVTRKALFIGDSLTAPGLYTERLYSLFGSDAMNLTLIGTINTPGTSAGNLHEGVSGWKFEDHYTRVESNFVFSGAFNFAQYLSTNGFTMTSNDWVCFQLGINDVFNLTNDNLEAGVEAILVTAAAMITNIQATVSGVRIGIGMTTPGATEQNAFGDDYGIGRTRWEYERNRCYLVSEMIKRWGNSEASKIYLVPTHANLDTDYNFPTGTLARNAHNATTDTIQTNGVHPSGSGYNQIGDTWFHLFKALA